MFVLGGGWAEKENGTKKFKLSKKSKNWEVSFEGKVLFKDPDIEKAADFIKKNQK